jgi:hypothetical protein
MNKRMVKTADIKKDEKRAVLAKTDKDRAAEARKSSIRRDR